MSSTAQVLMFPDPEESSPGEKLAQVWQKYVETMTSHQKALAEVRAMERSLFPGMEDYRYSVSGMSERDLERNLGETAKDVRMRLSWMAGSQFAPHGGRLQIDEEALAEAFPVDHHTDLDKLHAFDPAAIWAWLDARYGGNAGETIAHRQLASRLKSALRLGRKDEIVMKAGYVVLSETAYTESYSSGMQYGYHTYEMINRILVALSEVATWMERHQLSRDLYSHANGTTSSTKVISREKFGFGEQGAEVLMVTFKSSVEFRLRADIAEQLQVFLATYGEHEE